MAKRTILFIVAFICIITLIYLQFDKKNIVYSENDSQITVKKNKVTIQFNNKQLKNSNKNNLKIIAVDTETLSYHTKTPIYLGDD